ncbi:MAG: AMP-binding protein [Planctomycetaceae bacterium]
MNAASAEAVSVSDLFCTIHDAPAEDRLATAICSLASEWPDRPAIVSNSGVNIGESTTVYHRTATDYASLAARVADLEAKLVETRPIGIVARTKRVESLVVIAAACGRQHVPLAVLAEDARDLVGELSDWTIIDDSLSLQAGPGSSQARGEVESVPPRVVLATTGKSGPPRLVDHSWDSLVAAAATVVADCRSVAWLLTHDATRWAGIQVWMQALLTGGRLIVPANRAADTVVRALVDDEVAVLSCSPSLAKSIVSDQRVDRNLLSKASVRRVLLCGSAANEELLDQLGKAFPTASLLQISTTNELGEVFRVADGRPGFPASWLGRSLPGGARLRLSRDGRLLVQLSRDTAEVETGDVVELKGDRCHFTSRVREAAGD